VEGQPFVGPAGRLLDEVMGELGMDRSSLYVTNAVKHFKFELRGKRRVHAKPSAREVAACAPWLEAEIGAVRPAAILCLGVTPAQALLGREFRMGTGRGVAHEGTRHAPWVMATWHPSALLRMPDAAMREKARAELAADLRAFAGRVGEGG
jgi:DNA polymerase